MGAKNAHIPKKYVEDGNTPYDWIVKLSPKQRAKYRWEAEGKPVWKTDAPMGDEEVETMVRVFFDATEDFTSDVVDGAVLGGYTEGTVLRNNRSLLPNRVAQYEKQGFNADGLSNKGVVSHETGHGIDSLMNSGRAHRDASVRVPARLTDEFLAVLGTKNKVRGSTTTGGKEDLVGIGRRYLDNNYDKSSHAAEMVAEAFSMLATDPDKFKKIAPKSWRYLQTRINNDNFVRNVIDTQTERGVPIKRLVAALVGLGVSGYLINRVIGQKVVENEE